MPRRKPSDPICICRWPGCLALEGRKPNGWRQGGYCKLHYNKRLWLRRGEGNWRKRHRSRRIYQLLFAKTPRYNPNPIPLTAEQQEIYQHELTGLLRRFHPQDKQAYGRICARASQWARKGGRKKFYQFVYHRKMEVTIARKWLVKGNYDKELLERLLSEQKLASAAKPHLTTGHE